MTRVPRGSLFLCGVSLAGLPSRLGECRSRPRARCRPRCRPRCRRHAGRAAGRTGRASWWRCSSPSRCRGPGRLLNGGVFRHRPAGLHDLLVAFAARPRADDEADGEPRDERGAVTHLAPLSRKYVTYNMTFPHNARVLIGYGSDKHGLPRPVNVTGLPRVRYPYPGRSRVAQSAERPAVNRQVIGSSPIAGARLSALSPA